MQSELDVRTRLLETEAQLRAFSTEVSTLQHVVKLGDEGWRVALERLAECHKQRSVLEERRKSLAWVLAQGEDIVPIPGTKRRKYLEENVGAADVRLNGDDLRRLDEILPPGVTSGERYHAGGMATINR